jgi:hypothetical protein
MKQVTNLISAIQQNDAAAANAEFSKVMKEKVNTILEIKKLSLTADIYNKVTK